MQLKGAGSWAVGDKCGRLRGHVLLRVTGFGAVEPLVQEGEDPVERCAGRVAGLVDEVDGEHGVCSGRDCERVAGRGVDLDSLEGVAESASQGLEACGGTAFVVAEPKPEHAQPVLSAFGDGRQVVAVQS